MTQIRQPTQVFNSETYDDQSTISQAAFEPASGASNIQVDLNNLRTQVNNILSALNGDWYDNPFAGGGGAGGTNDIPISGDPSVQVSLNTIPIACFADVLTNVTVGAGNNFVVLDVAGSEAPSQPGSLSNDTEGVIVAESALSGAPWETNELTERAGSSDIAPNNLVTVRDATTLQPIQSSGRDVFALIQVENGFANGAAFTDVTPQRVKLSFVRINAAGNDLEACPVADIENTDINYNYPFVTYFKNIDPSCFTGSRSFVDQAASVDVTLQNAYVGGNTITTSAGEGNVTITGDQDFIVSGSVDVDVNTTGAVSIDADAASNLTVDGAQLDVATTTSGDLNVSSAGVLNLDSATQTDVQSAGGVINVGTDAVATAIGIGNATGASAVTIAGGTGTHSISTQNAATAGPIMTMDNGGSTIGFFAGSGDPNGTVNAGGNVGSLYAETAGGQLWVNTDGATTWVQFGSAASVTLEQATENTGSSPATLGGTSGVTTFETQIQDGNTMSWETTASEELLAVVADAGGDIVRIGNGTGDTLDVNIAAVDIDTNGYSMVSTGAFLVRGETASTVETAGAASDLTIQTTGSGSAINIQTTDTTSSTNTINITAADNALGAGNSVNINSGASTGGLSQPGGQINLVAGNGGPSAGTGGTVTVTAGSGGATGVGGQLNFDAGAGGATSGAGGQASFTAGSATGSGNGGNAVFASGDGADTGAGGGVSVLAGAGGAADGLGGEIQVNAGDGGGTDGSGGSVSVEAGEGLGTGAGGAVNIDGGNVTGTGIGGAIALTSGTSSAGSAGDITILAPDSASASGGTITLRSGVGSTTDGLIELATSTAAGADEETIVTRFRNDGAGTGAGGQVDFYVSDPDNGGTADPNGVVTARSGSLWFENPSGGTAGTLYLNTSTGSSGTTWAEVATSASAGNDLQQAYVAGNTITTSAPEGPLDVSGTEAISLDAGAASNFSVAGASLTLETTGAANTIMQSEDFVLIGSQDVSGVAFAGGTVITSAGVTAPFPPLAPFATLPTNTASAPVVVQTGTTTGTGVSGVVSIESGSSVNGDSGGITITTGATLAGAGSTGPALLRSGNAGSGNSGQADLRTGSSISGDTGIATVATGNATAGASGNATMNTGTGETTGSISIFTANATVGTAGTVSITAGNAAGAATPGAGVTITAGDASGSGLGGSYTSQAGDADTTGIGGIWTANAGDGGSTSGAGGSAVINAGNALGGDSLGGGVDINAGAGSGNSAGGSVSIDSGDGGATGNAGAIAIVGGDGGSTSGGGGNLVFQGGGSTNGAAGDITIAAGSSTTTGAAGSVNIQSGGSGNSTAGLVTIQNTNTGHDEDDPVLLIQNSGINGEAFNVFSGTSVPTVNTITGSLWVRDDGTTGELYINTSAGGSGTTWEQVATSSTSLTRDFVQGVANANITAGNDVSDAAPAANVTMDFGSFPTFPTPQAAFNTRVQVWVNGVLQRNGVTVTLGTNATDLQFNFQIFSGDIIQIQQWSA